VEVQSPPPFWHALAQHPLPFMYMSKDSSFNVDPVAALVPRGRCCTVVEAILKSMATAVVGVAHTPVFRHWLPVVPMELARKSYGAEVLARNTLHAVFFARMTGLLTTHVVAASSMRCMRCTCGQSPRVVPWSVPDSSQARYTACTSPASPADIVTNALVPSVVDTMSKTSISRAAQCNAKADAKKVEANQLCITVVFIPSFYHISAFQCNCELTVTIAPGEDGSPLPFDAVPMRASTSPGRMSRPCENVHAPVISSASPPARSRAKMRFAP